MTTFTDQERARIVALGDRGWSGSQIARVLGRRSQAGVNYHLLRTLLDSFYEHQAALVAKKASKR